ncbi:MAG: UDP-N-acetylmuramoyl-tripeptide--D-alanyl-D-alanine ligase [Candidatus Aenigmatarchaeota archaeon]
MLISDFKILENLLRPREVSGERYFKPLKGFSIDSRSIEKQEGFIALEGKFKDGHNFISQAINRGASLIISQKKIDIKDKVPFILVNDTYKALEVLANYVRKVKAPFVYAITGSVGKTTTKEILSYLLEEKFRILKNHKTENNILGVAKTIFSLRDEEVLVLELGTNKFGEIKLLSDISFPNVGIITFIKPVHLEGLKNLKGVFEEKTSLLKANSSIQAVLNRDDIYLRKVNFCKKIFWFGKDKKSNLYARFLEKKQNRCIFLVQDRYRLILNTSFENFIYNALAAIAGAMLRGLSLEKLVDKLSSFNNFPSCRMEFKKIGNFFFINDAYNSNPFSFKEAVKAVKIYPFKKIAVVGDMLELGDRSIFYHRLLAKDILEGNFEYTLLFGNYVLYLKEELNKLGYKKVFHFSSHKEIADFIKNKTKERYLIFLKGSRKMELERVVEFLS